MTKVQLEEHLNKQAAVIAAWERKYEVLSVRFDYVSSERNRLWSLCNELTTAIRQGSAEGRFPRQ